MFNISKTKFTVGLLLSLAMTAVIACGGTETVTVVETVVVEKEVQVKGDTVVEKVVETVKGDTVTVEKEVLVVATATAQPAAPAPAAPLSKPSKPASPPLTPAERASVFSLVSVALGRGAAALKRVLRHDAHQCSSPPSSSCSQVLGS